MKKNHIYILITFLGMSCLNENNTLKFHKPKRNGLSSSVKENDSETFLAPVYNIDSCTTCSILKSYDLAGPERVNTHVSRKELLECAPKLEPFIKNFKEFRLRNHNYQNRAYEMFSIDAWNRDTIFELFIIREKKHFDLIYKTPNRLINKKGDFIELGDLQEHAENDTILFFIKYNYYGFNVSKWEREHKMEFSTTFLYKMDFIKIDTLRTYKIK